MCFWMRACAWNSTFSILLCLVNTAIFPYLWVPHLWSQPVTDWKYLWRKKILESSKKQILSLLCYKFLHSIYIVGDIISNPDMIESIQKDVCKSYANMTPFLCKDHVHPQIWGSAGVLEPILGRYQGITAHIFPCCVCWKS